jgi:inorganic pyrophosphatase
MTDLTALPLRTDDGAFHVVVEAPRGSPLKLKYEPPLGVFVFKRPLPLGLTYPYDWGFFPSTAADDGDPLDAMVLFDAPTWPGVVIPSVPIGVLRLLQKEGAAPGRERNDRVLVVPSEERRVEDVRGLPPRVTQELEQFFVMASKSAGKDVTIGGWEGPDAARESIRAASEKFAQRAPK